MKRSFHPVALLFALALLFTFAAIAAETTIAMKDLPAPVRKAVAEQSKGATIRGLSKEIENGRTEYEAELTVDGHSKDISFDAAGKVVSVEEEVRPETLPAPALAAIQKAAAGGALLKIEAVTEGGKSFYEAALRKNGKSREIQVDANGARIR